MAWRYEKLPCLFCRQAIGNLDALYFSEGAYQVVNRNGENHAACRKCLKAVCTLERRFWDDLLQYTGDQVERMSGKKLEDLNVRCKLCGAGVSDIEKQWKKLTKRPFYYYRNRWRTRCYDCRVGDAAL
ncbi:E6 [Equus caballus papillomavirus 4]|uniref:Protein E6 n=2 Tax=Equus caballus papillomavirus 4 TaxID=1235428 RepID=K9M8S7_9PAPI|nr:E6 [Equus caballus papillomavirus 4]AFS89107.1 E6 [Equus caballus papillomavirus 4]